MTAPRLSARDIEIIRKRFWREKARQAREDLERDPALRSGTWFSTPVANNPVGTY